jgi:hypothetical protein
MARGRTPVEAWMGTFDEVDFFVPLHILLDIHFFYEKRGSI